MCGIVGALAAVPFDPEPIARMRDLLAHRGPDAAGMWAAADHRVAFGHRRLAIIDPQPEANQPFVAADGRYVLVFNGEIYNYRGLREELRSAGESFVTTSDTEVLLAAWRRWGRGCLPRLAGQFAFALWDAASETLSCARDATGQKPFYYTFTDGAFVFASELKALVAWPAFRRRLDPRALVDFLTLGFVPDGRSVWEGCAKLPPGQWLETDLASVARGRCATGTYWDLTFDPDEREKDWSPRLLATLTRAADEAAVADVPIGSFLSGGVDSAAVTAALCRAGHPVRAFTIGFAEPAYDERPFARRVAEQYGVEHHTRTFTPEDAAAAYDGMVWTFDEPFNDYSFLPTFHLCRAAREQVKVALSGDGGDELFAGYRRYQRIARRAALPPAARHLAALARAGALALPGRHGGWRRTLAQYSLPADAMFADMLNVGFPLPLLARAARGPLRGALAHYRPADTVRELLRAAPPGEVGLVDAMRYLDLKLTLAGDILVKVDRASMAASLEVRPLMLHPDVVALAARIPAHRLASAHSSKEALKAAVSSWLPRDVVRREKQGFAAPLGRWLATAWGDARLRDLHRGRLREHLDAKTIERLTGAHLSGARDLTAVLHALLFLDRWLEKWA